MMLPVAGTRTLSVADVMWRCSIKLVNHVSIWRWALTHRRLSTPWQIWNCPCFHVKQVFNSIDFSFVRFSFWRQQELFYYSGFLRTSPNIICYWSSVINTVSVTVSFCSHFVTRYQQSWHARDKFKYVRTYLNYTLRQVVCNKRAVYIFWIGLCVGIMVRNVLPPTW